MDYCLLYMTAASADEARRIGAALVDENLAACVNVIDGMTSIYRWEGAVRNDSEAVFIAKTRRSLVESVVARVKALHSYTCPCVVALPILDGNPAFLEWIGQETKETQ
jgi:periplasmic divalent cation tolerance protein